MPPLVLDILVDEQGRPVLQTVTQTVGQDIPVEGSTLSPAESLPMQEVMQSKALAFHAVQSLNTLAAQAADAFQHLFRPQDLADFQRQQAIAAKAQDALLTTWTSVAEEHARSQQFQQELWTTSNSRCSPCSPSLHLNQTFFRRLTPPSRSNRVGIMAETGAVRCQKVILFVP